MKFLLINPYAADFACYDYWLKPLGLLYISSILKEKGHEVQLIDCLYRSGSGKRYGRGSLSCSERKKPAALKSINRKYRNYGIYGEKLNKILKSCKKPDLILLSTSMTYWYPAAAEVARTCRHIFPGAGIIAGGTYVSLCPGHAEKNIDADYFFKGGSLKELFAIINEKPLQFPCWPAPDYSHYPRTEYAAVRTSAGCKRGCLFCGIDRIWCDYFKRSPEKISDELKYYRSRGIKDTVFYDDALLANPHLFSSLEPVRGFMRFHTPNGLNVKKISKGRALDLKKFNFIYPTLAVDRIGEEGGGKNSECSVEEAVENMYSAGYHKGDICAYIILGLPGQELSEVMRESLFLHRLGLKVILAEYAVVPGAGYDSLIKDEILSEPLLHNNSIFPCLEESMEEVFKLKRDISALNRKI